LAWHATVAALDQVGIGQPGFRIAVAVEGLLMKEEMLVGQWQERNGGIPLAYEEVVKTGEIEDYLIPWFAPDDQSRSRSSRAK
jgi:hypothetical protein